MRLLLLILGCFQYVHIVLCMVGIDLLNMMCTLYKHQMKMKALHFFSLTIVMENACFFTEGSQGRSRGPNQLSMNDFQIQAATSRIIHKKTTRDFHLRSRQWLQGNEKSTYAR